MNKKLYFIIPLFFVFVVLQSQSQKMRYFTRVGCIDLQRLIDSISKNPKLCKILSLDTESISKIQQIKSKILDFNNQIQILTPGSQDMEIIQQKVVLLQEELNSIQGNFSQNLNSFYRNHISDTAYTNLFKEIKKLALRNGFSLILEKDASVLYMEDDVDLTDQIIQKIQSLVQ